VEIKRGFLAKEVGELAGQGYGPNEIYHMLDKREFFRDYASEVTARTSIHTVYKRWKNKQQ